MTGLSEDPLRVEVDGAPHQAVVVRVGGEVDIATVGSLSVSLEDAVRQGRDVVVDLAEVTFMSAAGVEALVHAREALDQDDNTLTLRRPSAVVERVLEASGLDEPFDLSDAGP